MISADNGATSRNFIEKMRAGQLALGTVITVSDPTITEALCNVMDFVWIDTEHNPLSLETVQSHVMATKGSNCTPIVRVPWNDPVLIKPVLDVGAAGVIVPLIRTAEDARRAVAACRYPPDGIRGFGPRRPSNYGRVGGPDFIRAANASIITIVQIEHMDAVANLDEILAVPGLGAIVIGSNDLSGSMGHMGEPRHPDVLRVVEQIITRARQCNVFVGVAIGDDLEALQGWVDKGANWLAMGTDYSLMLSRANYVASQLRAHAKKI